MQAFGQQQLGPPGREGAPLVVDATVNGFTFRQAHDLYRGYFNVCAGGWRVTGTRSGPGVIEGVVALPTKEYGLAPELRTENTIAKMISNWLAQGYGVVLRLPQGSDIRDAADIFCSPTSVPGQLPSAVGKKAYAYALVSAAAAQALTRRDPLTFVLYAPKDGWSLEPVAIAPPGTFQGLFIFGAFAVASAFLYRLLTEGS